MTPENTAGSPSSQAAGDAVELSVVLPAYQEEENLRLLLPRLLKVLGDLGVAGEVLVVDIDPPLDATAQVCDELGVRHVPREGGRAYGDAVRTGIRHCRGRFVVFMDADGSHTPEFLPALFERRHEAEVVIASRYIEHGFTENPWALVAMSRVLNWTYQRVLGIGCKDVSNSFRLYDAARLKALTLRCNHFDLVEEILIKLKRQDPGVRFLEIPGTFKKRLFGQTKRNLPVFVLSYLWTMVKLRFFV